jgi:hypothetical protein
MKNHVPSFEDFVNEDMLYSKDKPLFNSMEPMSPANFLKAIKGTPEGSETNTNFGKGIEAVKFLDKNLKIPIDVYVYRSQWNYGGNLVVVIGIKGMSRSTTGDGPFQYTSGSSTGKPQYSFGHYFDGLKDEDGDMLVTGNMVYGGFKSIRNHAGVLQDIVNIFNQYEEKMGSYFNPKQAQKLANDRKRIQDDFRKLSSKIDPLYDEMRTYASKLRIEVRSPYLDLKNREVRMRIDEPREYRHENEYGGNTTSSKEYDKYSTFQAKIVDQLEKFAKKYNLRLSIAASWSN